MQSNPDPPPVPPAPAPAPRPYHSWFVTLVAASGFSAAHFGNASQVPDSILTLANTTTPWTMCAVLAQSPLDGAKVYKCFSNVDITAHVPRIFARVLELRVHHWPYTFPSLAPTTAYQPLQLGPRWLYLGALESLAVAMECSVIAGRNAALTIAHAHSR